MNRTTILVSLMGGLLLGVAAGCTSSDDDDSPKKVRLLTITETNTRATLAESGDGELSAKWTAGDGLAYCNLGTLDADRMAGKAAPTYGPLTAKSSAATSQFEGSVSCGSGDKLAVVYPSAAFGWSGDNAQYTITLSGQDGTLETLAKQFHYVYGVATVTSVTDETASATMPKTKSLLTVCKFSFTDGSTAIPIKTLTICYDADGTDGNNVGTYPQTATVTCGEAQDDVHAVGVAGTTALTVTCTSASEAVHVALLPTTGNPTFRFTVTDDSGNTYTGTASATLNEGEYVPATGLKLTKQ